MLTRVAFHRIDPDHDCRDVVESTPPVGFRHHLIDPRLGSPSAPTISVELLVFQHSGEAVEASRRTSPFSSDPK